MLQRAGRLLFKGDLEIRHGQVGIGPEHSRGEIFQGPTRTLKLAAAVVP